MFLNITINKIKILVLLIALIKLYTINYIIRRIENFIMIFILLNNSIIIFELIVYYIYKLRLYKKIDNSKIVVFSIPHQKIEIYSFATTRIYIL